MLRRYKLRLPDGTALVVDRDGLNSWALDAKAMVQAVGSHEWFTLREFLAVERIAAKREAGPKAGAPPTVLPLVYPTPRQPPPVAPVPAILAAPPEAWADEPEAQPSSWPLPAEAAEAVEASERVETRASAEVAEPLAPDAEPMPAEEVAAPTLEGSALPWAAPMEEAVPEPVPEPAPEDVPEPPPFAASEPLALAALAEESLLAGQETHAPEPAAVAAEETAIVSPPMEDASEEPRYASQPPHYASEEPTYPIEEPPFAREEPPLAGSVVASDEEIAEPLWQPDDELSPPPSEWLDAPAVGEAENLSALGDELAPLPPEENEIPIASPTPIEEIAIIPFKPVEEADRPAAAVYSGAAPHVGEVPRQDPADERLLKVLFAYANVMTVVFRGLARGVSALRGLAVRALARRRSTSGPGVVARLRDRLVAGKAALLVWAGSIRLRAEPSPKPLAAPAPTIEPPAQTAERTVEAPPRRPAVPPPPVLELPALRFAETHDAPTREDVYDGEEVYGEDSRSIVWRWLKRIAVLAILVGSAVLGAVTWQTWTPWAARSVRHGAAEIEAYRQSREDARQLESVLAVAPQLPHLSPETIRLVLASRPASALDAPEIFRLAYEAEDAGRSSLSPAEAQELSALRGRLLGTLGPVERERVREYDGARGHRTTFAFENSALLEYFARGWRELRPPTRERLHVLSGKAIAAGLGHSAERAAPPRSR